MGDRASTFTLQLWTDFVLVTYRIHLIHMETRGGNFRLQRLTEYYGCAMPTREAKTFRPRTPGLFVRFVEVRIT